MRNRIPQNRRGITLLFVISMIVLFLLMGTAFVVVSNNFLRSSKKRARVDLHSIDGAALVEKSIYNVLRGPDLKNMNSPLRCQDILSDMYGYGFRAFISDTTPPDLAPGSGNQFIRLRLTSGHSTNGPLPLVADSGWQFIDPDATTPSPLSAFEGFYNGFVLTFVSGTQKGLSVRIFRHDIDTATTPVEHSFWIPMDQIHDPTPGSAAITTADLDSLKDSEVVINGREFSGRGAGAFTSTATHALTDEALKPNQKGKTLTDLKTDYLTSSFSTNEPWDAADYHTMFLSGKKSTAGPNDVIASFHRDKLVAHFSNSELPTDPHMFSAFEGADLAVDSDNDGEDDAFWMDTGEPVISNGEGQYFKPLVAYKIVDLDGRINLNAHGNFADADMNHYIGTYHVMLGGEPTPFLPRGQGWGPAEISLGPISPTMPGIFNAIEYDSILKERYGKDNLPGAGDPDLLAFNHSRAKLFGHPFDRVDWGNGHFGTAGNLFASSPMDLFGRLVIGTPEFPVVAIGNPNDDFRDLNITGFHNGMPVIDMATSTRGVDPEFFNSPYEMSFAPHGNSSDRPFTPAELERILRPSDPDSNLLEHRLWNAPATTDFWKTNSDFRDFVTTESHEVPVSNQPLLSHMIKKIVVLMTVSNPMFDIKNMTEAEKQAVNDQLKTWKSQNLVADDLLLGLRMNVNRPFGNGYDNDNDGVVDNPGEEGSEVNVDQYDVLNPTNVDMDLDNNGDTATSTDDVRTQFARQLYSMAMLITENIDFDEDGNGSIDTGSYAKAMAQWAVNIVDFRDPDSIMTRFIYDPEPWDAIGWTPTDEVWGCERPELLITETIAGHDRRTEDIDTNDPEFEQRLRPEAFAFFELYNPWTQNSLNQVFDSSLYDPSTQGVDLARRSLGTNSTPVWRISVDRPNDRSATNALITDSTALRFVYFTDPDDSGNDNITDDNEQGKGVFFSSFAGKTIRPGSQALVGSLGIEDPGNAGSYRTFLGRRSGKTAGDEAANLELDITRHIEITPASDEVVRFPADPTNNPRYSAVVPIDQFKQVATAIDRSFAISDPDVGYPTSDSTPTPFIAIDDGYKYTTPFDDALDPFTADGGRTVEDMAMILTDNGVASNFRVVHLQRLANPLNPWDDIVNPYITVDSMEVDLIAFNGVNPPSTPDPLLATAGPVPTAPIPNTAVSLERGPEESADTTDRRVLWNSQRKSIATGPAGTGDHYFDVELTESLGKTNDLFVDANATAEGKGFPWLTWNNRPYVSHLELANVPYSAPDQLTRHFTIADNTNPYVGFPGRISGTFGHLLNFFGTHSVGSPLPELYRIFEFLEVPSRFVGTESNLKGVDGFRHNPHNTLSRYRVPGKINLNTIYSEKVWNALMGNYSTRGLSWTNFKASRNGSGNATEFENPFRPAGAGNYVATGTTAVKGPHCTLFRDGATTGVPLFDFVSTTSATMDTDRSAYFRNAQRQRLANLTTTRSSVFAIWVTVGYFEANADGTLKTQTPQTGIEVGSETGEVRRNRGFCIFDRSIPVAFEPGKNHNIDQAILIKTIIE